MHFESAKHTPPPTYLFSFLSFSPFIFFSPCISLLSFPYSPPPRIPIACPHSDHVLQCLIILNPRHTHTQTHLHNPTEYLATFISHFTGVVVGVVGRGVTHGYCQSKVNLDPDIVALSASSSFPSTCFKYADPQPFTNVSNLLLSSFHSVHLPTSPPILTFILYFHCST